MPTSPVPKKVKADTPVPLDLGAALAACATGRSIRRLAWEPGVTFTLAHIPGFLTTDRVLAVHKPDGSTGAVVLAEPDLTATDWVVLP